MTSETHQWYATHVRRTVGKQTAKREIAATASNLRHLVDHLHDVERGGGELWMKNLFTGLVPSITASRLSAQTGAVYKYTDAEGITRPEYWGGNIACALGWSTTSANDPLALTPADFSLTGSFCVGSYLLRVYPAATAGPWVWGHCFASRLSGGFEEARTRCTTMAKILEGIA